DRDRDRLADLEPPETGGEHPARGNAGASRARGDRERDASRVGGPACARPARLDAHLRTRGHERARGRGRRARGRPAARRAASRAARRLRDRPHDGSARNRATVAAADQGSRPRLTVLRRNPQPWRPGPAWYGPLHARTGADPSEGGLMTRYALTDLAVVLRPEDDVAIAKK